MSKRAVVRAGDVMKEDFDRVQGRSTISQALENMTHPETSTLIVDKRHDDDEHGIVYLSDIARQVISKNRSPDRVNIYEIMTKPVFGVSIDMDIRYCARLLERCEVERLPVFDGREIVGIISYTDIVLEGVRTVKECNEE